jgi:hypothetical protein
MKALDMKQLAQPPTFDLDLFDGGQVVGWLTPHAVGFRGFESEGDAMHAAFLAHRTLARRLALRDGRRPIPIGNEPLRLKYDDTVDAAGRRIAIIVRPGVGSRSGPDSFGFELPFSTPLDEVTARAKFAYLYWAVRRSGIRWAMWRSARPRSPAISKAVRVEPAAKERFTPETPWWLRAIGLWSVILLVAVPVSPASVAPLFAGCALLGLAGLRLFAMKTGWPFRPVRFARVPRNPHGDFK